jgi:hypothetical protein
MRFFTPAVPLLVVLLPLTGCREGLTDENFPDLYLRFYAELGDDGSDDAGQLAETGYDAGEVEEYLLGLVEDEARFSCVMNEILDESPGAALSFALVVLDVCFSTDVGPADGFTFQPVYSESELNELERALDELELKLKQRSGETGAPE